MRDATRLALAAIVAAALALRLAHVASVAAFEAANAQPGLDRWLQMEIARAVAGGDWLGGPLAPYESAPAYALGLGLLYRLGGGRWVVPIVLQAVLGAFAPLALYATARRLGSARAGLFAAALAAVYGPAIFYEGLTLKFALMPCTVSALLCASAAAAAGRRWQAAAAAAGAATALLVALRLNAIVVLPVVVAWITTARPPAVATRELLLVGLGLVAIAAPLALRRGLAAAHGEAASLWGIHFYVGSRLDGDGGYTVVPGVSDDVFGHVDDARALAEASRGRRLTPAEVSRYWLGRGLEEIRRDPAAYLVLEGRKLRRLLAPREEDVFGDDYAVYAARSLVLRAGLTFGAVAPLAMLGLVLVTMRRAPLGWCVAVAAAYAASLLVFFVTSRYRLPVVPPLLLCAGAALAWLADLRARPLAFAAAAGGLSVAAWGALGAPPSDVLRLLALLAVAWLAGQRAT